MSSRAAHLPIVDQPVPSFARHVRQHGGPPLRRQRVTTLQVNVGKLCNMSCLHCHVEAGPKRTEIMTERVAQRVVELVAANPSLEVVDFTGGAPELNPNFRYLVSQVRGLRRQVIDRSNLSVLFEKGNEDLPEFLAAHQVRIVASLPCYQQGNVDSQRGKGAFELSIDALRKLNEVGYGKRESCLTLDLVYNPTGAHLPPEQRPLEQAYKKELLERFGIIFNNLLTITNMPIRRFLHALQRESKYDAYMKLLVDSFNPSTLSGLMCKHMVSVGWDGQLYDCDFNQMLELRTAARPKTIWDITSFDELPGSAIATGSHCFGCTAGAGSSCGGALDAS